jgi:1,4-dihydroxy-2-naphthoate octaprenyltransferase
MSLSHRHSTGMERLAIVICLVVVLGLIRLTLWKENYLFWINVGGYPLWLRDSVRFLYYPYLLFTTMCLGIVTRSVLGRFFHQMAYRWIWILLLVGWVLYFSNAALLVANNVKNILADRPIHYHAPRD